MVDYPMKVQTEWEVLERRDKGHTHGKRGRDEQIGKSGVAPITLRGDEWFED